MTSRPQTFEICYAIWLLVLITGCNLPDEGSQLSEVETSRKTPPLKVNVIEVQSSESVYQTVSSYGTVKPNRSTYLAFGKGGRVAEVLKEVGDKVEAGDKLAALAQEELQTQLEQVNESKKSAEENLARLSTNPLRNSSRTQVNRLTEQVATLEAQQNELEKELKKGTITAPFPGIIAERNIDLDNELPAGRPAFKLVDDAPPIVELQVTTELAKQLSAEQQVWLGDDEELVEAKVAFMSPELSAASLTQSLTLEIAEEDLDRTWVYGDAIEARFWIPTDEDGFWLPYSALQREHNGLWAAFVVYREDDQNIVGRRIIEIVQLVDGHALVRGALGSGDQVIVEGSNRIVPGQRVTPNVVPATFSQIGPPTSRLVAPESSE